MTPADHIWWNRYDWYLASEWWAFSREAAFRRDGYRCRRCGLTGGSPRNPLQADHLTYENYNRTGRTPVSDLCTPSAATAIRSLPRGNSIALSGKSSGAFGAVLP